MEYKSEIDTPVYYTIKNCSIYTKRTSWVQMEINNANSDEFVIKNFALEAGEVISFFNNLHTSNYKVTLDASLVGKYGYAEKSSVYVNVGGNYNVYINSKTYVVRFELLNPESAVYGCIYYDGQNFNTLSPTSLDTPYIFRQRIIVETKYTTSVPDFYSLKYKAYSFTVVDPANLLLDGEEDHYFKQPGTYDLIINLQTFEITVELLPE